MLAPPVRGGTTLARFVSWAKSWLLTTNHKRVGVLYIWTTFVWFLFAGVDALAVRWELRTPGLDTFRPDLYNALFTFHGTQMVFLFAIPVFTGFANIFLPPMVGAKDMAFPRLNALAFWLVFWSGALLRIPLFWREFAADGWTNYAPLSTGSFSPDFGEDWWIWSIFLETASAGMAGINFLVTVFRARKPGTKLSELPVFVHSMIGTSALAVVAGPFLLFALLALFFDRYAATAFFQPVLPNSVLLWENIFWFYSHPATYIMILPAFGIVSEVLQTFGGRPFWSRRAVTLSIYGTTLFSMLVFWHHMFVTGMDPTYSAFGSVATFGVAFPTAVLFLNWIGSLFGASLRLTTAALFALAFIVMFGLGGVDGVYLASIPLDVDLHHTYWLTAHIHFVLYGGSALGATTAVYYWFPSIFGRRLHETWGKVHLVLAVLGGLVTFLPMHVQGMEGMVRRIWQYDPRWTDLNVLETVGAGLIALGYTIFLVNVLATLAFAPAAEAPVAWSDDDAYPERRSTRALSRRARRGAAR
jgi:cytochrome c oxidase subunit 1